jgi:hypothetical protein
MRKLLSILLLLIVVVIVGVGGVGFYRGWFSVATASDPEGGLTGVQLNIDRDKMKSDAQKAKQTVSGAAGDAKEPQGK